MGQVPPKSFLPSAPYGSSEGVNALNPSQPAGQNPQQPLLPSNFQDPGTMSTQNLNPVTASSQVASRNPFGGGNKGSPIMRGLFGAILFLLLALPSLATTTIGGHIADLGTIAQSGNTFVRFTLRGCAGGQPRVLGTALISPTQGAAWYKDFAADSFGNVSGTIYSTRDSTGFLSGDIDCNGSRIAVWYGMTIWQGGKSGPEIPIHARNGIAIDVTNVTPITVNPVVVAPTGDTTYCRLDAGNGLCPNPVTGFGALNDAVIYVSINGNDGNNGLTWSTAKLTLPGAFAICISNGCDIIMGSGIFLIPATITFPSQGLVNIRGNGMGTATGATLGGTRLVASSGSVTPMLAIQGVSAGTRSQDVFIRDVTIQGVYTALQTCITIDHATFTVFDHVQFSGCGQAEWINDSYRTLHRNVNYFNSGSGGTNTTAMVRVENVSNPGVQAEQAFWDESAWEGGANEGMAVYFGPAENTGHIINSKIDYSGFAPNYCIIQIYQGADISLIDNFIASAGSVAPAPGLICADGTVGTPAFNLTMVDNPVVVYGTTVPAVYLNYANFHEINNNQFFGNSAGNPAIVTTANTSVGTVMHNRINTYPDTVLNDVSNIQVACNISSGANQLTCTTPITTNKPIVSTSTITTNGAGGLVDNTAATKFKRPYCTQGTPLVVGDFVLSGWGTSPSIVVGGYDPCFAFALTAGTGSPSANPTVVFTYHDGAWADGSPICQVSRGESQTPSTAPWQTSGSTTVNTFTFVGTPIASATYVLNVTCGGR